jgi:hypothetical protein
MSFPPATEMFQFAGFASRTYGFSTGYPLGWVAPFGDPGINDRSHLPRAFRSVPRPSSPLSAKASTRCPSLALLATPNGKRHESLARPKFDLGRALLAVSAPGLTRGPSSRLSNPEVLTPRGSGGPSPSVQQTLFSPEDTLCGIGHDRPRARQRSPTQTCTSKPQPARHPPSADTATVTQLASLRLPSATHPRRPPGSYPSGGLPLSGDAGKGNSALLAAFFSLHRVPAPLRVCFRKLLPARNSERLPLEPAVPSVVEVIGLEPTTPCLQSRCSPS